MIIILIIIIIRLIILIGVDKFLFGTSHKDSFKVGWSMLIFCFQDFSITLVAL